MADREKVIKALENCKEGGSCDGCSYDTNTSRCILRLHEDALALLKEQEAVKPRSKVRHGANAQIQHFCGNCMKMLHGKPKYCSNCGRPVLWEGR